MLLRAGHINFNDEVSAAMRLADGVLLVVDAAEGVMLVTEKAVKQALGEGLPIALLLTKVAACPLLGPLSYLHFSEVDEGACVSCCPHLESLCTACCSFLRRTH
jgi:peptide subunit release factor RF-3